MRLLAMDEWEVRSWQKTRVRGFAQLKTRISLIALCCLLAWPALFFGIGWEHYGSLQKAWATAGWLALQWGLAIGLGFAVFAVLLSVGVWWLQEWRYRVTKRLPRSVRGFDIEDHPVTDSAGEALEVKLGQAMNEVQQRDWERARARGMIEFVIPTAAMFILCGVGIFCMFWLGVGSPLSFADAWESLGWEIAFLPMIGVALPIVLWFLNERRYRKAKGRLTHA